MATHLTSPSEPEGQGVRANRAAVHGDADENRATSKPTQAPTKPARMNIPPHVVERWRQRVAPTATEAEGREQVEAFLSTASIEGKPRNWMKRDALRAKGLERGGAPLEKRAPYGYAYNDEQGGVCVVLAMTEPPRALTVVTRALQRQGDRRYDNSLRTERLHRRMHRQRRIQETG